MPPSRSLLILALLPLLACGLELNGTRDVGAPAGTSAPPATTPIPPVSLPDDAGGSVDLDAAAPSLQGDAAASQVPPPPLVGGGIDAASPPSLDAGKAAPDAGKGDPGDKGKDGGGN